MSQTNNIYSTVAASLRRFKKKHPALVQFLVFFVLSNGVTLLQMVLMPLARSILDQTSLLQTNFQIGQFGSNFNGTPYYIFDYAAGPLATGGGGGLSYFLAVQITMAIAQIINFFLQRNITFKSNASIPKTAAWYLLAYVIITFGAAALQGLYKAPIYNLLINTWNLGTTGERIADAITMIINSAISFWVFFPIFKLIFKNRTQPEQE